MGKVLMTGAGGGVKSDDVTASRGHVLQGFKTITTDSNDEVVEGLIPNLGAGVSSLNSAVNVGQNHYFMDIPTGYYYGGSSSGTNTSWVQTTLPRLRQDIGATNPAMWRVHANIAGLQGTIPDQGPWTVIPKTANQVAIYGGHYSTGNIVVSGDPNLVPGNIKKNAVIFGVRGTHEGWVAETNDLYRQGQNPAGFSRVSINSGRGTVEFGSDRIRLNYVSGNGSNSRVFIVSNKTYDLSKFNILRLNISLHTSGGNYGPIISLYKVASDNTRDEIASAKYIFQSDTDLNRRVNVDINISSVIYNGKINLLPHGLISGTPPIDIFQIQLLT